MNTYRPTDIYKVTGYAVTKIEKREPFEFVFVKNSRINHTLDVQAQDFAGDHAETMCFDGEYSGSRQDTKIQTIDPIMDEKDIPEGWANRIPWGDTGLISDPKRRTYTERTVGDIINDNKTPYEIVINGITYRRID